MIVVTSTFDVFFLLKLGMVDILGGILDPILSHEIIPPNRCINPMKSPVFFILNIHMLHIFRLPAGSVQKCWIPKNCRLHRDREWGLKHQNYGWSILHCLNPIQFSIVKSSSWMVKIPWKSHIFHRQNPFLNPMFVGFFINFKPALSHRIGWWENFNRKAQTIWW